MQSSVSCCPMQMLFQVSWFSLSDSRVLLLLPLRIYAMCVPAVRQGPLRVCFISFCCPSSSSVFPFAPLVYTCTFTLCRRCRAPGCLPACLPACGEVSGAVDSVSVGQCGLSAVAQSGRSISVSLCLLVTWLEATEFRSNRVAQSCSLGVIFRAE